MCYEKRDPEQERACFERGQRGERMAEYIEREALYQFLSEQKDKESGAYSKGRNAGLDVARSALHNREITPTADVVPVVHGRWKSRPMIVNTTRLEVWMCSVCGVEKTRTSIYCPNCGARMDGE